VALPPKTIVRNLLAPNLNKINCRGVDVSPIYDPAAPAFTTYVLQRRLQLLGSGDGEVSCVGKLKVEREAGRRTLPTTCSGSQDTSEPLMAFWSKPRFASRDALKKIYNNFCNKVVLELVFCFSFI